MSTGPNLGEIMLNLLRREDQLAKEIEKKQRSSERYTEITRKGCFEMEEVVH